MFENNPFATHTLEILIMLLGAFFIGLWLGWALWGRLKEELERFRLDNQSLNVTLDAMRLEIESVKTRAVVAETDNIGLATQVTNLNRESASLREKAAFLETELAELQAHNREVETELGLSYTPDTPVADDIPLEIKEIVTEKPADKESVNVFVVVNPGSQDSSQTVVEVHNQESAILSTVANATESGNQTTNPEMPTPPVFVVEPVALMDTKPEKPSRQKPLATAAEPLPSPAISTERDDLTVVEGIGPKIQMLLNQYNIFTYRQLAEADVVRLKEILGEAGPQLAMHDPGTWPSQANLAANDQWDTLKSVQGFLKGGKKPD
ncbi:MAG: hypothetical protein ACKVUS_12365 [Saprospiraceae bacterium]